MYFIKGCNQKANHIRRNNTNRMGASSYGKLQNGETFYKHRYEETNTKDENKIRLVHSVRATHFQLYRIENNYQKRKKEKD